MAWSPTDLVSVAKVTGIASSGIFAGYTWALSDAAVPAILAAKDEVTMAKQWRIQYVRGFILAVPATIINIFSWGLLAYATKNSSARQLYVTAAITTGSGTVFAWTALRHINGALSIRSAKIAGPWTGFGSLPLTYSAKEKRSIDTENKYSTAELMVMWKNYNLARSVVLLVGTLIGAYALAFANSLTE
ncbi:hypothetical protein EG327_008212 [Venturia inaequalis]|uniref:DUF1772-domain-containing protein n=1 Tax=Venturia inaequalis TaxID=5025 RepID=A0A8H3YY35_VENIN|nr:hypothetical protein EG327_008212 [Venturia inaequalis]